MRNFRLPPGSGYVVVLWLSYFLVLLVTMFPHGLETQFLIDEYHAAAAHPAASIPATATLKEFEGYYGGSDPGSYIKGGEALATMGVHFRNFWATDLWPPGMFTLHALRLKLFPALPPIISLGIVLAGLWATIFSLLYCEGRVVLKPLVAAAIPFVFICLPMYSHYLFHVGIVMSEPYAAGFLALTCLLLFRAVRTNNFHILLAAGLTAACAALFRTQADLIMVQAMLLITVLAALAIFKKIYPAVPRRFMAGLIAAAFLFCAVTGLYRWYNKHGLVHMDYAWAVPYRLPDQPDIEHKTLFEGGMNAACLAEPKTCVSVKYAIAHGRWVKTPELKHDVVHAIIHHPWFITKYKGGILLRYWFSGNTDLTNIPDGDHYIENALYLALMVGTIALGVLHRRLLAAALILILMGCAITGCIVPSIPMHFEVRFLFILKVMSCILFLLAVFMDFRSNRSYLRARLTPLLIPPA